MAITYLPLEEIDKRLVKMGFEKDGNKSNETAWRYRRGDSYIAVATQPQEPIPGHKFHEVGYVLAGTDLFDVPPRLSLRDECIHCFRQD